MTKNKSKKKRKQISTKSNVTEPSTSSFTSISNRNDDDDNNNLSKNVMKNSWNNNVPSSSLSLTASIFGGSSSSSSSPPTSSPPQQQSSKRRKKRSSSSEDATPSCSATSSLFGSKERFQSVVQKHQSKLKKTASKSKSSSFSSSSSKSNNNKATSRDEILQHRKNRTASTKDIVDSITVHLPELPKTLSKEQQKDDDDDNDDDDDEENETIRKGILRLMVGQAGAIFRSQGVLILKSSSSKTSSANDDDTEDDCNTTKIVSEKLLKKLQSKTKKIEHQVCQRLDEVGKEYRRPFFFEDNDNANNDKSTILTSTSTTTTTALDPPDDNVSASIFRFSEVASRCIGRLDIRHGMDKPPFSRPEVLKNPYLLAMVHDLLGNDAVLVYAGLILSFPNSSNQPWHQDGNRLFPELDEESERKLPPYALNVFLPVSPVTEALGPTEFWTASHLNGSKVMKELALADDSPHKDHTDNQDDDDDDDNNNNNHKNIIAPLLMPGDALLYDYRICHRGTSNLSSSKELLTGETRPMIYLMYARPWFQEHLNFGTERLFET